MSYGRDPLDEGPQWHPLLRQAFAALDRAAVSWCLLRPPEDPARPTGDIDLLVHPLHLGRVPDALARQGLARIPDAGTPDHFYLRYDPEVDSWIYLHVTARAAFGPRLELETSAAGACLARRVPDGGVWRLNLVDEFWITLLHALFDKNEVSSQRRERLRVLARSADVSGPVADALDGMAPQAWPLTRILQAVRDGAWDDVLVEAERLAAGWRSATVRRRRAEALRWWLRLALGVRNPWRRRGLSVALIGPDGAGKSTLASGLQEHFFFPCDTYYMDVKDHELEHLQRFHVPGLIFAVYMGTLWRRVVSARILQAQGHLVIFDRYSSGVLVDAVAPSTLRHRLARWVHTRLFPRAGMVLVLDLPGEVMFSRKGERDPDDLEAERQRLLLLGQRVPNVRKVDASRSADCVRRESTSRIWEHYAQRWGARLEDRAPESAKP